MDKKIIYSITQMIIDESTPDDNPIDFYNRWRRETGIVIKNSTNAQRVLDFISRALKTDKRLLAISMEAEYGKKKKD